MKFLVTGGSGFIGSELVRYLISEKGHQVSNLDKFTYAGNNEKINLEVVSTICKIKGV